MLTKLRTLAITATVFALTQYVYAADTGDKKILNNDQSGGKKLSDIMKNIESTAEDGASMILILFTLLGFVICGICLYTLWRASKDERDAKPLGAIVGLLIGGVMAGVGSFVWIMHNTVMGTS